MSKSRKLARALLQFVLFLLPAVLCAADWPTYQHDNSRSGVIDESLSTPLVEAWTFRSLHPPQQAWPGAAKWDGWNKVYNLKDRMEFDRAFQLVAVGDRIYFGSSVDDKVYCLDATTGQTLWSFFTEGPVRLAPTFVDGLLYFGSDDGNVYCLNAADGSLVWKHRLGPEDRRIPGNDRVISVWAIRSGVVREGDVVYACAGVFPCETVYLCAMEAATGKELWKTSMNDFPAQGYMLSSATRLFVTTGRSQPLVFDRSNGKRLHQAASGSEGGTYALVVGDTLTYGPGKTGQLGVAGTNDPQSLASFEGNHMIVTGGMSFLHTDTNLSALDREAYIKLYRQRQDVYEKVGAIRKQIKQSKMPATPEQKTEMARLAGEIEKFAKPLSECVKWKAPCDCPLALIMAGDKLFAGGTGEVAAFDPVDGKKVWQGEADGGVFGLSAGNGRLFASTDAGTIHCFAPAPSGTATKAPVTQVAAATKPEKRKVVEPNLAFPEAVAAKKPGTAPTFDVVHGPFIEFVDRGIIEVTWDTMEPSTSLVEFGIRDEKQKSYTDSFISRQHEIVIHDVQPNTIHTLRVGGESADGRDIRTAQYVFDSTFEYLPLPVSERASPFPTDELDSRYELFAKQMFKHVGQSRGYALVLGGGEGRLAYHLAVQSELRIVVVEPDAERAERIRKNLDRAGLYGSRVAVIVSDYEKLPFGPYFANLVTSDETLTTGKLPASIDEILRVSRPAGGILCVAQSKSSGDSFEKWLGDSGLTAVKSNAAEGEDVLRIARRSRLPGSADWTHQYASPDNSSCSQDELVRGDLSVLWWGNPGPRPMPDRGPRNPAPVSANGRLFIQGNRTLFGLDQYNGAILWTKQIPTMRRANVPRDGSNMVAADDFLYVAMGDACVSFEASTGKRELNFHVEPGPNDEPRNWGYLACVGDNLIGTSVKPNSQYEGDQGEWYEDFRPEDVTRVTSDRMFAVNRYLGDEKWRYEKGAIMNSTISISDGTVYFIESRNPQAVSNKTGRQLDTVQKDQHLVALDLEKGKVRWEKPYDFGKCEFMTYTSVGQNTLIVMGSDRNKVFHTYAFDSRTGYEIWKNDADAKKTHHSGQLHHPAIVGDKMYVNKRTYELSTGNVIKVDDFDWHGCGVMSASKHTIFHRFEYHGMLDLDTNKRTEFLGIRTGCWLSMIPSGGVILAPETSAGRSCSHSIQTSIAYVPKSAVERKISRRK